MSVFVAIEGPNGVGKSTIARLLVERLRALPRRALLTTEPTDTAYGRFIRSAEADLQGRALALAVAADRDLHITTEIIPALDAGMDVVTDRYAPSSLVLQRIDGMDLDEIWGYNRYSLEPALTVYLTDTAERIKQRLAARSRRSRLEHVGSPARELELYDEARVFLDRRDWVSAVVDCAHRTAEQVAGEVFDQVKGLL